MVIPCGDGGVFRFCSLCPAVDEGDEKIELSPLDFSSFASLSDKASKLLTVSYAAKSYFIDHTDRETLGRWTLA